MQRVKEVAAKQTKAEAAKALISHERLRKLYATMVRVEAARDDIRALFREQQISLRRLPSLDHPAMVAGMFSHLRDGDMVGPATQQFAASVAVGTDLRRCLAALQNASQARRLGTHPLTRANLGAQETFAMLAGLAKAQALRGCGNVVVAVVEDELLADTGALPMLHRIGDNHLPLVLVTLSSRMPEPGESQNSIGFPQIAVDGADVVAIFRVAQESLVRARNHIGPTWIQCVFPAGLRPSGDRSLSTMQSFLQARGLFNPEQPLREKRNWNKEWAAARPAVFSSQSSGAALPVQGFDLLL